LNVDYSKYAPEFEVLVNGNEVPLLRNSISSIQVNDELQSSAKFQFSINDEFGVDKGEFVWFDNPLLQPGNKVSIKMGYAKKLLYLLPVGTIENILSSGFTNTANQNMTVTGYDDTKKILNDSPKSKDQTTNQELKGNNIIKLIQSRYNSMNKSKLDFSPQETTKELSSSVTKNSLNTYGDILSDQAKRIGWTYFFTRGKAYYIDPRQKKKAAMTFERGKEIIEFIPKINTSNCYKSVIVRSSHPTSRNSIKIEVTAGSEDKIDNDGLTASQIAEKLGRESKDVEILCSDDEEAKIRGKALLNLLGDDLLTAKCRIVGTPELKIGQMVQINRIGKRFSGKYFVTSVTNTISSSSGYLTDFSIRSNVLRGI